MSYNYPKVYKMYEVITTCRVTVDFNKNQIYDAKMEDQ